MFKRVLAVLAVALVLGGPTVLLAQGQPAATEAQPTAEAVKSHSQPAAIALVGAAIGAGVVVIGGAIGISRIGSSAVDAMARQPEAASTINTAMLVTAAMVEGATLFAVVVCLLGVIFGAEI